MLICPLCETVYPDGSHERCPGDQTPLYIIGDDAGVRRSLQVGDTVAGKYELLEEVQRRAGAGRTFKARQVALDRLVELRILPENSIIRPSDHARFQREVSTWGKLRADHLVRLYDSGFTEHNAPYMALEYVAGGALGGVLQQQGPLTIELVRTIARHTLRALEAAHGAHVLHRDITPDALVLDHKPDGSPHCRLTGFGLAKHLGDDDDDPTAITMTGQVVGNPAYMAPETILMGVLDPRTDLYALGVTLYELTTGHRPFPGRSLADMLAAHVRGNPVPMERYRADAPPDFSAFVAHLLEREPAERFQSATDALAALDFGAGGVELPDLAGGLGGQTQSGGWATGPRQTGGWAPIEQQSGGWPTVPQQSGGWPTVPQPSGGWPAQVARPGAAHWKIPTPPPAPIDLAGWPAYDAEFGAGAPRRRMKWHHMLLALLGAMALGGLIGLLAS